MGPPREKPNKGKSASETNKQSLKLQVKTSAKEQPQRSFGNFSWLQGRSRVQQASNRNEVGSGLVWGIFTLMLVVVNLANTKLCKSPEKMPETMAHLRVLSKSYPINTNLTGHR